MGLLTTERGGERGREKMAADLQRLNCGVTVRLPPGFDVTSESQMRDLGAQAAPLMREHNLVHVRQAEEGVPPPPPRTIRAFYEAVHAHRFPGIEFGPPAAPARSSTAHKPTDDGNIRGASFPGFNETHALGRSEVVEDWHGLSGSLKPRSWWEDASGQWHSDGGFSKVGATPART